MQLGNRDYEFLRPLVTGWLSKVEKAREYRGKWQEIADECMLFYSKSAAAMWSPEYQKKFWRNIKAPRFRITINKAFELVAVFAPNLIWDYPFRQVNPKKTVDIPQELFQDSDESMALYHQLTAQQQAAESQNKTVSFLMQEWLNYTPRETPGGGLLGHSILAVTDALIKGRGCLWTRPYSFPSSGRTLIGSFREPPENLLTDPDFHTLAECKWIALKHVEPHWSVERRFQLEPNSLKGRATLESSWVSGEVRGQADAGNQHRQTGKTNDLVVWYEIWSKTGPGARLTGMETVVKEQLEEVAGDFAYICVAADVPYPLNCPTDVLRKGATSAEVKQRFEWPVPLWTDDRWPVNCLDFYADPDHAWPIAPLAPAMGELKFLNFMVPWLCNRIYSSSRDFIGVMGGKVEEYRKYLEDADDQTIIPVSATVEGGIKNAIEFLQQPETRYDAWKIVELVSDLFDKRTGLTEFAYGRNEGGTQDRTAEATQARARAVGVRPEWMQRQVVSWQSEVAVVEAFLSRWFVKGQDIRPLLGPVGEQMWNRFVMTSDVELVVRQMQYGIEASSIRRPNRERDMENFNQLLQVVTPFYQQYGTQTGDFTPFNWFLTQHGKNNDVDVEGGLIPPPQGNELEQQKLQMEQAKLEADLQGKQLDIQAKILDAQAKQAQVAAQVQGQRQQMMLDVFKAGADIQQDQMAADQKLVQERQAFLQESSQKRVEFRQELAMQKELAKAKVAQAKKKPTNGKPKK